MRRELLAVIAAFVIGCVRALAAEPETSPASFRPGDDGLRSEGAAQYFDRHAEGWFWYRDPPVVGEIESSSLRPSEPAVDDPVQGIERERRALEVALDRAILDPTPVNVRSYLVLNERMLQQSSDFAKAWKATLFTNPDLDYRQVSPVGAAAYVKADVDHAREDQRLREVAAEWGLVFFFRGSCPYCHKLAPTLRAFADRYGFRIIDVSLDGAGLPEFPAPRPDAAAGKALGVEAVPAVFLLNPRTRQVVPAAYGLMGWTDLVERVLHATGDAQGRTVQVTSRGGLP